MDELAKLSVESQKKVKDKITKSLESELDNDKVKIIEYMKVFIEEKCYKTKTGKPHYPPKYGSFQQSMSQFRKENNITGRYKGLNAIYDDMWQKIVIATFGTDGGEGEEEEKEG